MKLYCRGDLVVASHGDEQQIAPETYGDGVVVITVPDGYQLERAEGVEPAQYLKPVLSGAAELKAYLADKRWQVETGGVTLPGNTVIQTDAASQAKIAQAIQSIDLGITAEPIQWKAASGWLSVTRDDLVAIATAVAAHVQAAFAAEAALSAAIDGGSVTTTDEIDAADWP